MRTAHVNADTLKWRLVATLDSIAVELDDAAEIEATIAKEVEINPSGEFAAALKMLGVAPTAAAIDALRDELIPGGRPRRGRCRRA